jgi:hypothetical protein
MRLIVEQIGRALKHREFMMTLGFGVITVGTANIP